MKFSKAKIFFYSCLGFVVGVAISSFINIPFWLVFSFGAVSFLLIVIMWKNQKARVLGFCILFAAGGILRFQASIPVSDNSLIQQYNGQETTFIGLISSEPDTRKSHVKLTIDVKQGLEGLPEKITGKVLVNTYLFPEYHYGDLLKITCQLQAPEPITDDDSGRVFNYDKYLTRFDIYSLCYRPYIEFIAADQGNVIMSTLLNIKTKFVQAVQLALPEPQASFLGGLILGAKKAIPDDLMESFNRTGTTHIVALSGYNITIIAILILNLCKHLWISRKGAFWVSLFAITFFVLITGAQASIVRAGIMGMLVLLATQLGRMSRITNTLVLAAVVMLLINPKVLVFDAGFQLSFLATIGLVYVSPIIEKVFKWVPAVLEIRASLVATLSATLMTLPLIIFQFGRLSLVAPLVNVLILPAIPVSMGLGFITGI
ncbi:competence protein ComEC family protein, partial [Patescibacteria group bacterium]|nr:competence protein ComEC family protein [Patescibacteria group bacterium]